MADFYNSNLVPNHRQTTAPQDQEQIQRVQQKQQERLFNREQFGVDLPDNQYKQINDIIAQSENPDEESYKIASSLKLSQNLDMPFLDVYANIDTYIDELDNSPKDTRYRNGFTAIGNMFQLGKNNNRIGELGNLIMEATAKGDTESLEIYRKEYEQLKQNNELLQDNAPRRWYTKALESAAQSAPFTGAVSGAALFGNFILPGVGGFLATTVKSAKLTAGQEYLSMIDEGIDHETAYKVSRASGLMQGLVEASLDTVTNKLGDVFVSKAGSKLVKSGRTKLIDQITNNMQKRFHFGPGKKLALNLAMDYVSAFPSEMAEEALQSAIEDIAHNKAARTNNTKVMQDLEELKATLSDDLYNELKKENLIDEKDLKQIVDDMTESAKGAFLATLVMGAGTVGLSTVYNLNEYKTIQDKAEKIPSYEVFKNQVSESPIFENYKDENKKNDAIRDIWENAQSRRDKKSEELIAGTKETTAFSESMEEAPEENDEGETPSIPAYRTEEGKLYTNNDTITEAEDGKKKGSFRVGNGDATEKNLYGFINYTLDDKNNTVTIDDFKMTSYRKGLTLETFDQFAEEFAGRDIIWNPVSKAGKELKKYLISQNINGKNNNLNYYTQEQVLDKDTRRSVAKQIKKYMPNLTSEENAAAVSLLELGARRQSKSITDYVQETFGTSIFGNPEELNGRITAAQRQDMQGATTWRRYGNQLKAVIYAGETANFSTWAHEVAHIWQSQLTGDLKRQAEEAFGVKDGNWIKTLYTINYKNKNGEIEQRIENASEAFARGFEDYIQNGIAPNENLKNLFQKFAEFLYDIYKTIKNFITMTPEIQSVYDQLLADDASVMSQAKKAVEEADRGYKAKLEAEEKARKAQEQQQKADEAKVAEEEKAEQEEITLNDENLAEAIPTEPTAQEAQAEENAEAKTIEDVKETPDESKVIQNEEELNKNLEELSNYFDFMGEELRQIEQQREFALMGFDTLPMAEAQEVVQTVTNPDETLTQKVETASAAAIQERDDQMIIFQLAGLEGTRNIVNAEERARRLENYYLADKMSKRENLGYDNETLARKIKQATGWEKNASGKWIYETDDSQGIINAKVSDIINNGRANALSDKRIPAVKLSALYKNDELYEMYPIAKDFVVQFYTDKIGVNAFIQAEGIAINTAGLKDAETLKRRLVHEIQHIIQAVENYAEGNTDISQAGIHGKDFTELWQSLQQAQISDGRMYDATSLDENMSNYMNNAAEIDARNVARRAFMSARERKNSLLTDTADVKEGNILFQLIGEKGATNLDLAEEATTRRDNLAIAKDMEKAGKDAKSIRFATGWEKGKDGLWRYETDDSQVRFDSFAMLDFEKKNPRYNELLQKLYKGENLTDAEQQEMDVLNDAYTKEYNDKNLSESIQYFGKSFRLNEILDNEELYKAYPQLKYTFVSIKPKNGSNIGGRYSLEDKDIVLYVNSDEEWKVQDNLKSTLLHEIQHAIQYIEGFAEGGSPRDFESLLSADELRQYKNVLLNNVEYNNKKAQEILDKINKDIDADNKLKEFYPKFKEGKTLDDWFAYLTAEQEKHPDYEEYKFAKERAQQSHDEAEELGKYRTKSGELITPEQAYYRLAGEVESRNVQARINFTPEERLNTLLAETADVAPEDQIVLFEGLEAKENNSNILFQTVDLTQDFAGVDSGSITEQMIENHLNSLIGQIYDTATKPLQIQLTKENNPHVKKSNVKLEKGKKKRHFAALNKIEQIINNASMIGKPTDVDLNHNTNKKTIKHKNNVLKYIYFESPIKINNDYYTVYLDTERVKNQEPALLDLYNIRVKKNILTGTNLIASPQGQVNNSGILPNLSTIYLQTVYHGSGASFDRFNTAQYGLSGEGSMSFGYGTYVTDSEEIARDYAERQYLQKYGTDTREAQINSEKETLASLEEKLKEYENKEAYEARTQQLKKDLETANTPWRKKVYTFALSKRSEEDRLDNLSETLKGIEESKAKIETLEKELADIKENAQNAKRNLYTVEIPENGYLTWDKTIQKAKRMSIMDKLYKKLIKEDYAGAETELRKELIPVFDAPINGKELYQNIWTYLGGDKETSQFLNSIGYAGIKYLAGTNYGNGNGAYNYVIFDDESAKIVDHLYFQTQEELYADARNFSSWQEFMEYYENDGGKPETTVVPNDADAQWYKTTWTLAKGINQDQAEVQNNDPTEITQDSLFIMHMREPGVLEDFLQELNYLDKLDFDTLPGIEDDSELDERNRQAHLKDVIRTKLRHASWLSNATRVANGKELTNQSRERLLSLIGQAAREYRDVYTQITGDTTYAVPEEESYFNTKIKGTAQKLNKLVSPEEAIGMSPEQLRTLADNLSEELSNKEIAAKIKNGTLKMDSELTDYIKRLEKKVKEADDRYHKLKVETEEDYKRINDSVSRQLLQTYEELLKMKSQLKDKKNALSAKVAKGIKITEKYQRDVAHAQSTYDNAFIAFNNLMRSKTITAELKEAMKRKEDYIQIKKEQAELANDKAILKQIQEMRRKLVKTTMRRIPFNRIDYNTAKTIIAIQRIFYPNLEGGVSKWIGENPIFIKGLISEYLTNPEVKQQIDETLSRKYRASANRVYKDKEGVPLDPDMAAQKRDKYQGKIKALKELLEKTKSSNEVDQWDAKTQKLIVQLIPKQDWIRELKLDQLEEERRDSIQLDIDENGIHETKTYTDAKGKIQTFELWRATYSEEVGNMVLDAIGHDLFNRISNKPFEDWTISEAEQLAKRINELYIEGRDTLAAKREEQKKAAEQIRDQIRELVKETGIVFNDTDTPEEKEKKKKQLEESLGSATIKGTLKAGTEKKAKLFVRLFKSYGGATVRRVARILDGWNDGVNVNELYWKENACYNAKESMIYKRNQKIEAALKGTKDEEAITLEELYAPIQVGNQTFTVDELLNILAADQDYETKTNVSENALETDPYADNDDYAPTARNAIMFGNFGSSDQDVELKEKFRAENDEMQERINNGDLTDEEAKLLEEGNLVKLPGTKSYIAVCHARMAAAVQKANEFISENPKYKRLLKAIQDDYAEQFERMQVVCIEEFNSPVMRVKNYVPLYRLESNGDTNENCVKEDLLATSGASAGQNWVDKGMTQRRVSMNPLNQKPVELGLYKTWAESTERTEHFINYAAYVRELNRVYKSRDAQYVRRYIENRYGDQMLKYIDNYIAEVANPNADSATGPLDRLVRTLRGKTAPAYLSWKLSSIIKQAATSPAPYIQFVSPVEYTAACFEVLKTKGNLYDQIKDLSIYMRNRRMDPVLDVIDEQIQSQTNKVGSALGKVEKLGMWGLEAIDWACVAPGWYACFKKKLKELTASNDYDLILAQVKAENEQLDFSDPSRLNDTEMQQEAQNRVLSPEEIQEKAVEFADDCTRLCQPSNRAVDLSPLFKSKGKGSEITKAVLQFQTSLNVIWNNLRYDLPYAIRQKKFKQIVGMLTGYTLAGIAVGSITEGYATDDDDEKDSIERLRKFLYYSTTQYTDAVPFIGSMLTQFDSTVIAGNKGFSSNTTDLIPMFTKVMEGTKAISKADWEKACLRYGEAAGLATGLPVSGAKELLRVAGIGDGQEGLDFKPQAFVGRRD